MTTFPSLSNQLLIAMPNMGDGRFEQSVTYLCEHDENGAMGIIINRPLDLKLQDILRDPSININDIAPNADINQSIHLGGPVQQDRGFVLHNPTTEWESSLCVGNDIMVTTSKDIMAAILRGEGPENTLIAIGYAGWGPGQLEEEIKANAWLTAPVNQQILFEIDCNHRWQAAAQRAGIDIASLTLPAGHA